MESLLCLACDMKAEEKDKWEAETNDLKRLLWNNRQCAYLQLQDGQGYERTAPKPLNLLLHLMNSKVPGTLSGTITRHQEWQSTGS